MGLLMGQLAGYGSCDEGFDTPQLHDERREMAHPRFYAIERGIYWPRDGLSKQGPSAMAIELGPRAMRHLHEGNTKADYIKAYGKEAA